MVIYIMRERENDIVERRIKDGDEAEWTNKRNVKRRTKCEKHIVAR